MKKLGITLGLSLIAIVALGQKKAVSEALKLAKDAKPNYNEARAKIKEALVHAETKDDAKTWFTAGQIESAQFDTETAKQLLNQKPDEAAMYNALGEIYPYFLKAYELDKIPDAKGRVKPKFIKDMKAIMKANLPYYINGAAYYSEQNEYRKSYDFFNQYIAIADGQLLKENEKPADKAAVEEVDSNYVYAVYYSVIMAFQLNDHALAVDALIRANKQDFKKYEILQYLAEEYKIAEDTVHWEAALKDGLALFPKDEYFLFNLVGIYLSTERNDKAIEFISAAIQNSPNDAGLYKVAGIIYESGFKDYAKAEEAFKKSVELDGENDETQSNLGRIYFNQG
ncbi:MAG: hypothetical protein LBT42_08610, partial [Tannerella sp.]|nr:hypothetical protein [Tannerella sp.]